MVPGFSKQTVEKRGSLVFCGSKSSEAERERMEPLERMSVFVGNARRRCSSSVKKRGSKGCNSKFIPLRSSRATATEDGKLNTGFI
jgi:hypothetical protein